MRDKQEIMNGIFLGHEDSIFSERQVVVNLAALIEVMVDIRDLLEIIETE